MPKPFKLPRPFPLPPDAEIVERDGRPHVRLKDRGRTVFYPLTKDGRQYLKPTKCWYFDIKDENGIVPRKKAFSGGWEWSLPEGAQVSGNLSIFEGGQVSDPNTASPPGGNGPDGPAGGPPVAPGGAPAPGPDNQGVRSLVAPDGSPPGGAPGLVSPPPTFRQPGLEHAIVWLRTSLEAGPQPVAELVRWWTGRGYDPQLLYQARERLGVMEYRPSADLGLCWRLPG